MSHLKNFSRTLLGHDNSSYSNARHGLTRSVLIRVRTLGLRRRLWFNVLNNLERGLVDVTIRWVERVRSRDLALVLARIIAKLFNAFKHGTEIVFARRKADALRNSSLALSWGNLEARNWWLDKTYVSALALGILF